MLSKNNENSVKKGKNLKKIYRLFKKKNTAQPMAFLFSRWIWRSKLNFSLLLFDNFLLFIYFLFFVFLNLKNKMKTFKILNCFFSLNNNILLIILKKLNFLFFPLKFAALFKFLVFKLSQKLNHYFSKKFLKFFFNLIDLVDLYFLFFLFFKKILNFLFLKKNCSLVTFIRLKIGSFFFNFGKVFFFKGFFFFFHLTFNKIFENNFYWQIMKKNRFFFFSLVLWVYYFFDKITYVYWLTFFFFWLRNFIFLLFGLNWLSAPTKHDIFKAFEYSRNLNLFFNYNIILPKNFFFFDVDFFLFKLFNQVKELSYNFNIVYFERDISAAYRSFYFFQDKGSHFFLRMQKHIFAFNYFIDRILNQKFKEINNYSSMSYSNSEYYLLHKQYIKPNLKNIWSLDSFEDSTDFIFFCKKIFTNFFYLKSQSVALLPFFFWEDFFGENGEVCSEETNAENFEEMQSFAYKQNFIFSLKKNYFEFFFLFFLEHLFFNSFFFFKQFFFFSFFFKFVKILSFFVFFLFEIFLYKMESYKKKKFLQIFCFYLKNFLMINTFYQISTSFTLNYLKQDFWEIFVPTPPVVTLKDDSLLFDFIKKFSLISLQSNITFKKSYLLLNIAKKIFFLELFPKIIFRRKLKRYIRTGRLNYVNKFLNTIKSINQLKLQRLFFFLSLFEKKQEDLNFKKKGIKSEKDFNLENFLTFDLFNLGTFFFTTLHDYPRVQLPLIFWHYFKVNFFKFFKVASFVFFKKFYLKFFKVFLNIFLFNDIAVKCDYKKFLENSLQNFYSKVLFLGKIKKQGIFFQKNSTFLHKQKAGVNFLKYFFNFFFRQGKNFYDKKKLNFFRSSLFPLPFFNIAYDAAKVNISLLYRLLYNSFFFFSLEKLLIKKSILTSFFYNFFFLSTVKNASFYKFVSKPFSIQLPLFFKNRLFTPSASSFNTLQSFSKNFLKKCRLSSFFPMRGYFFYYKYNNFFFFSNWRKLYFFSTIRFINWPEKFFLTKDLSEKKFSSRFSFHSLGLLNKSFITRALVDLNLNKNFHFFSKILSFDFFEADKLETIFAFPSLGLFPFYKKGIPDKIFGFFCKKLPIFSKEKILSLIFVYFTRRFFFEKIYLAKKKNIFFDFFFTSLNILHSRRLLLVNFFFKKFFFDDLFFFHRSFFFFAFFDYFSEPQCKVLFFDFFSLNVPSFLVAKAKKPEKKYLVGFSRKVDFSGLKFNFFFFKAKGFLFFLCHFEVLLFIDDFFIWFFCFKTRVLKKRLFLKWKRVFFLKPFFFAKSLSQDFHFFKMLHQMQFSSFFSHSFNFLYNKKLIKQKGAFLKFYFLKNKILLFFDNLFWHLVPSTRLKKRINLKKKLINLNNKFFVSFFFFAKDIKFYFALPSFMKKINAKIFIEFLHKSKGSFLNFRNFFFFSEKGYWLKHRKVNKFFFLDFFFKRLFFFQTFAQRRFLRSHFFFLQWFNFISYLNLNSKFNSETSYPMPDFSTFIYDPTFFLRKISRERFALFKEYLVAQKYSTRTYFEPNFNFFLRYFYNHKVPVNTKSLVFLRYFNNLLQTLFLQQQREISCSFIKFFWKQGRKYWYLRIQRNFYLWDFFKKTWILFSKNTPFTFYFPQQNFLYFNDIFLARTHFKVFNRNIFNQFFSFSFIKRWTRLKFLYRMQDFLSHLSMQRDFLGRGLFLNYKGVNLYNNFFGTFFFLNNHSFYSFNKVLVNSFLFNFKSVFYLKFYSIFSIDFILKIFRSKQFFSIYFFLPVFSKKIFSLINNFKSISKTLFFFNNFFVRGTVNGFFWNFFSFINPFWRRNNKVSSIKMDTYKSHFCRLLFLDYRHRSFFSKFFSSRINFLLRFSSR